MSLRPGLCLLLAACSAAPATTPPTVGVEADSSGKHATAEPPATPALPSGPAIGSHFTPDPSHPLPTGAVARCGTTTMRAAAARAVAVTNEGTIWAVDQIETRTYLRDVAAGEDVRELPAGHHHRMTPDGRLVVLELAKEPGEIAFFAVPGGERLGQVTIALPKRTETIAKKQRTVSTWISDLVMSADGGGVVVVTDDGAAHLIDPSSFKLVKTTRLPKKTRLSAVSAKARRAVFVETEHADSFMSLHTTSPVLGYLVLDLTSGTTIRKEKLKVPPLDRTQPNAARTPEHGYGVFALSMDGRTLYRAASGALVAIDVSNGKETPIWNRPASDDGFAFRFGLPASLTVLADGERAVMDGTFVALDGSRSSAIDGALEAISPNGKWTVTKHGERFMRSPGGARMREGHDNAISDLVFLPDGKTLVVGSSVATFWDTVSATQTSRPKVRANFIVGARDKPILMIGRSRPVVVDEAGKTNKLVLTGSVRNAAFARDGGALYITDDYAEPRKLFAISMNDGTFKPGKERALAVGSIDVAPDGASLLVSTGGYGSGNAALELLESKGLTTKTRVAVGQPGFVAFAGNEVVHATTRDGVSIRALPSLEEVAQIKRGACCSMVAVSPDGQLLAGATGRSVAVWDRATRKLRGLAAGGHREPVTALAFSPDGRFLATGSKDTTVVLWDTQALPQPALPSKSETVATGAADAKRFLSRDDSAFAILADGSLQLRNVATKGAPPALKPVEKVVSSYGSHCAISAGAVHCWGSTGGGALGIAEEPGTVKWKAKERTKPVVVAAVKDAIDIAMAAEYVCALQRDGDLVCWGELGIGSTPAAPARLLPNVRSFELERGSGCAVGTDGRARCWSTKQPSPALLGVKDVVALSSSPNHTCLLDQSGKVHCVGDNSEGQLGDGSNISRAEPVLATGVEKARAISTSSRGTCALTSKNEVHCWGRLGAEGGYLALPTRLPALDGSTSVQLELERVCGGTSDRVSCLSFPSEN